MEFHNDGAVVVVHRSGKSSESGDSGLVAVAEENSGGGGHGDGGDDDRGVQMETFQTLGSLAPASSFFGSRGTFQTFDYFHL